jgi:hypothetical protein
MSPLSHAGDGVAEAPLVVVRCHCRGDVGCGVLSLSSHVSDCVAEVTLTVAQCCCRAMVVMALPRRRLLWHDVAVESCW